MPATSSKQAAKSHLSPEMFILALTISGRATAQHRLTPGSM
ncbi:hypothetical protein [Cytobacillus firmus]